MMTYEQTPKYLIYLQCGPASLSAVIKIVICASVLSLLLFWYVPSLFHDFQQNYKLMLYTAV